MLTRWPPLTANQDQGIYGWSTSRCSHAGRERRGERTTYLGGLSALRSGRVRRGARWGGGGVRLHGWLRTDRAGPGAVAASPRRLLFAGPLGGRDMALPLRG